VQRFVLAELAGHRSRQQMTSNLVYGWHMENCQRGADERDHFPSRAEQESVYRAVRSLADEELICIGYIHDPSRDGIPVVWRNVNLSQIVSLRSK
jgi:hypothetical protein